VVLVLLLAAMVGAAVTGSLACAAMVGLLSAVWVLVNKPVEGPVLVALDRGHGITFSDMVSLVGAVVAVRAVRRARRRARIRRH
jgi:hypothetical protein